MSARWLAALGAALGVACAAPPATRRGTPDDYLEHLATLGPGQVLELQPGSYRDCLPLMGLRGRPDAPVVIRGPARGPRPRFLGAGCAQVDLGRSAIALVEDSRWVTLARLELDGQGAQVSGVRALGWAPVVGLRLVQLDLHDFDASPQFSAISSFAPAWDWEIAENRITRVGLGMYLGNSDGGAPFIRGVVARNVVLDPLGYGIQLKHQRPRPELPGMPGDGSVTRIVGNVIRKAARGRGGEAGRPNLFLGAPPPQGPGRGDRCEVAGNLLLQNDSDDEPLLQGEGNLHIHHNRLINDFAGGGVLLRPHAHPGASGPGRLGELCVRHNTLVVRGVAIAIQGLDPGARVEGGGNRSFGLGPVGLAADPWGEPQEAWPDGPRWWRQEAIAEGPGCGDEGPGPVRFDTGDWVVDL
jgi:hypothetical protein